MVEWPRRVDGHVVDRTVSFRTGDYMEHRYRCVNCGIRVDDPEDPDLVDEPCRPATPGQSGRR